MRVPALLVLVLATVIGLTAAPALGHVPPERAAPDAPAALALADTPRGFELAQAISADTVPPGGIILAALVAVVACTLRRRRAPAATLALVLTLATFETALHATHHAGDPTAEAKCVGAQAASHLADADTDAGVGTTTVQLVHGLTVPSTPVAVPARIAASVAPRAPPVPTS